MGKKQIRTREPLRLAETVCGWHNLPGARKCEEIPYALIRLMTSHYQWDINAQTKHAPPRLGAPVSASRYTRLLRRGRPLRYGPRHYIPPLRGSHLFLWPVPGVWGFESSLSTPSQAAPCGAPVFASRFARLLRRGWPPPGYFMAPLRGSEFRSPAARKIFPPSPLQLPIYHAAKHKPRAHDYRSLLPRGNDVYCGRERKGTAILRKRHELFRVFCQGGARGRAAERSTASAS